MSFESEIARIIKNREKVTREIFAASALQITEKVITRTPVDTGRARGNWNASINSADDSVREDNSDAGSNIKAPNQSPAGQKALNRATGAATGLQLGDTFYLTNGLPYISRLEYGYSGQAPSGMLRLTVDEFNAALREIVRNASRS